MKKYDKIELYCCYVLYGLMLVASTAGVIARYIFNSSLPFTDELCRWALMWCSFLGASYCVITGDHLKVDVLQTIILKNHPNAYKVCETISSIIWIGVCVVMIYYGYMLVDKTVQLSSVLRLPLKIAYASLPVGAIAMMIRVIQKEVRKWFIKTDKNVEKAA